MIVSHQQVLCKTNSLSEIEGLFGQIPARELQIVAGHGLDYASRRKDRTVLESPEFRRCFLSKNSLRNLSPAAKSYLIALLNDFDSIYGQGLV